MQILSILCLVTKSQNSSSFMVPQAYDDKIVLHCPLMLPRIAVYLR